ncbi:MAG: TAXI family TRAP transporter solute-binding subunit, partial [Planctomycetota bacterium]
LVQGGLARGAGAEGLRHVASLVAEPLHLLVPADRAEKDFSSLFRGRRVNLSTPSSGTRRLAEQVLELAAIDATTYEAGDLGYDAVAGQLATADEAFAGPEVLFAVESLPGRFADLLVTEHGFTPVSIPFAEAVCLRDRSLEVVTIPAGTYQAWNPSVPAGPVVTVAPRLTLLARDDVPAEAVERLLAVLYEGDVRLDAELPRLDASDLDAGRELPLHDGASAYLRRNEPLFTTGLVDSIESARSFAFSALVAGFLIWRWTARRRAVRLEEYFDEISDIERRAFARLGRGEWDAAARDDYLDRLTTLKATAIEAYSSGRIDGHDQFNGFLQHVADARATVRSLGRG